MSQTTSSIPFEVDRNCPVDLTEQVAAGLRGAIQSGAYRPGDRLPGIREMARSLGTSNVVVNRAVRRLALEGRLAARRRAGTRVLPSDVRQWRAHVLLLRASTGSFYFAERDQAFASQLEDENIRVTSLGYLHNNQQANEQHVDAALASMSITHVVVAVHAPEVIQPCRQRGIPVIACFQAGLAAQQSQHDVLARVMMDSHEAARDLARYVLDLGSPSTGIMSRDGYHRGTYIGALRELGVPTVDLPVTWADMERTVEQTERSGYLTARRLLTDGSRPELLIVTDDHMARGAYMAVLELGVRLPQDMQMIVGSNLGNRIGGPHDFTRIENDPLEHGRTLAAAVVEVVNTPKPLPRIYQLGPRFIVGNTTRGRTAATKTSPTAKPYRHQV